MPLKPRKITPEYLYFRQHPLIEIRIPPSFCEIPFLYRVFQIMETHEIFKQYRYLIAGIGQWDDRKLAANTVVFYVGNEEGDIPPYIQDVKWVFSPYVLIDNTPCNLKPIPLGYNGDIPEVSFKPWQQRSTNIFFSGQRIPLYRDRDFNQLLNKLEKTIENTYFKISPGFRKGLAPDVYAREMINSRIALVPTGVAAMTFRLFEAARCGCILVCDPLPPYWFLKGLPTISLKDDNLIKKLLEITQDPISSMEIHQNTLNHYHKFLSEEATACYLLKELLSKN